jgi:predicted ribosomally synthesized peptide with SipW-like signal peptide
MKKILISLVMVLALGFIVTKATASYFSDTETSTGNTFTAGTLDLKADGLEGAQVAHVTYSNIMPYPHWSHAYGKQWVLKNTGSVAGKLSMTIQNIQNGTPACNGPKVAALAAAGLPACVAGSATGGQLGDLMFGVWSRNEAPWGYLSSVYTPFNTMGGVVISPITLNPGDSVAAFLDLEWDTHAGTLDNTAQGDTLSFDVVFQLDQVHP